MKKFVSSFPEEQSKREQSIKTLEDTVKFIERLIGGNKNARK